VTAVLRAFYVVCRTCEAPLPLVALSARETAPTAAVREQVLGSGCRCCPQCGRHHAYEPQDVRWCDAGPAAETERIQDFDRAETA
jgi:hypothetical protein